mgnify:CR=1 FL=1|jgi:hypothetical protein|tara:strand:- start:134 stop:400 length:267 start_codon:yes stop_codon:yes gene_type:complete
MLHKMETTPKATSLNHLLELIKNDREVFEAAYQNCENPICRIWDYSDLPTFGGTMPADTIEIFSWDKTRLLVGTCADDMRIISRSEDD